MQQREEWARRDLSMRDARVAADGGSLTGFPIVFNSLSVDLGGFKERILPEAVDRTLRTGKNVDCLVDHRRETTAILGSTDSGLMRMFKKQQGLEIRVDPPNTSLARDVITQVKAGLVKGMSFLFRVYPDGQDWEDEDGVLVRTISDMEFSEVSVVVNPAYPDTSISARSLQAADAQALAEFRSLQAHRPSVDFLRRQMRVRA